MKNVLISPLGFAAGAVSGVYYALKEQGIVVDQVITVGTENFNVREAASLLEELLNIEEIAYKPAYIAAEDLRGAVGEASGPFAARMGLYIDHAHNEKAVVHVAVTGGRSGMGALAALAAQIYRADHLYHLWVHPDIERDGIVKARADPANKYVNPTVKPGLCELVSLPFADLSYVMHSFCTQNEDVSASEKIHLVNSAQAYAKLAHYVPAGLPRYSAQVLLSLGEQWRIQTAAPMSTDPYYGYERGIQSLLKHLEKSHSLYSEALVYEQRLRENIAEARLYGEDLSSKKDRSKIIHQLNEFSLSVLNLSFNELCNDVSPLSTDEVITYALAILQTAGMLDSEGTHRLQRAILKPLDERAANRALEKAKTGDDMGFFAWLSENEKALNVFSELAKTGAALGTFLFTGLELWLKVQNII